MLMTCDRYQKVYSRKCGCETFKVWNTERGVILQCTKCGKERQLTKEMVK
jgi:hypothetical protein